VSFGSNIGYEQDGKNKMFERPALLVKKFNKSIVWVLPSTSQDKTGKYYYQFEYENKKYSFILTQLRTISSERLLRRIRVFPDEDFNNVKIRIKEYL
jgi:mRNA-degrading endonuclease toxin of MazEF toxin-antitoxin module